MDFQANSRDYLRSSWKQLIGSTLVKMLSIFLLLTGILTGENLFSQNPANASTEKTQDFSHLAKSVAVLEDTNAVDGAAIFEMNCAGCHAHGGNIIRRGKNLKLKTLQRRQLDSLESIAQLVTQGKGIMSAYGDRLTPKEIEAVSSFVLDQATTGWN